MFEKFTSVDARDFRQRYLGSYGFFRKGEKRYLVQLTEINSDRDPPVVTFKDREGTEFTLLADAPDDNVGFEFLPPRSSWKNTHNFGGVLSRRIVRRQWIRGLHHSNTTFTIPGVKDVGVNFHILHELFLVKPPSFLEAFGRMTAAFKNKQTTFAALSNSFALDWRGQVWCFDKVIGKYTATDGKFTVNLTDKLFTTEIEDAFRRNGAESTAK